MFCYILSTFQDLYRALVVLKLNMKTRVASNSRGPPDSGSCVLGLKSVHHHTQWYLFKNLLCMCKCVQVRDSLWEAVLSSHYMGSEDGAQVVKLGGMCLFLWSHLAGPSVFETGFCPAAQARLELDIPLTRLLNCWNYRHAGSLSFLKNEKNKVHKRWMDRPLPYHNSEAWPPPWRS